MDVSEILDRMRAFGDAPAIVWRDVTTTFRDVLEHVDTLRTALRAAGVRPGDAVAFEGTYSPASTALLLAITAEAGIAVPLSGRTYVQPGQRLVVAEVRWIAQIDEGEAIAFEPRSIITPPNSLLAELRASGHPGLVIFTSATTGESKAALHDFTRVLERYRKPRAATRMLALLIFDHIGGINTALYGLAHGGSYVALDSRTPDAICAAIAKHRVELLPATPTLLNMILMDGAHERYDLSSLKLVSYGTEVMPEATLTRLHAAFPGIPLQQMYGLTEIGVMRSIPDAVGSRWIHVGGEGFEVTVQDGTLRVRSPLAMLGYLDAPSPIDADGWLDTHDRVEQRGDAVLILGRDSDLINVGGEKVYPGEIESVLLEIPNVVDVTAYAHPSAVLGNVVAARFVLHAPEPLAELRQRVRAFCEPRLARYKIPIKIEIVDNIAVGDRYKKLRSR
jgi:long-chain acyl-CoA synthetase